jgi:hypothetical protein
VRGLPRPGLGVPDVHLRRSIGERVNQPHSNRERLGHFIVTGPDAAAVDLLAENLAAQITIEVELDPDPCQEQADV